MLGTITSTQCKKTSEFTSPLQVLFAFLTYKGDYNKIKVLTENFLKDYLELTTLYEGMQAIPEEEQVMKRRQSALKKPDSTTVTEADKIVDMARGFEAKTKEINTAPKEVNDLFLRSFTVIYAIR